MLIDWNFSGSFIGWLVGWLVGHFICQSCGWLFILLQTMGCVLNTAINIGSQWKWSKVLPTSYVKIIYEHDYWTKSKSVYLCTCWGKKVNILSPKNLIRGKKILMQIGILTIFEWTKHFHHKINWCVPISDQKYLLTLPCNEAVVFI